MTNDKNDVNKITWVQLKPDRAFSEVDDAYKAGIIGLRLGIVDITQGPYDWPTVFTERLKKRPGNLKVRAYIF